MRGLTAFTWGYWGWGTHTAEFVRAVDAIERTRGKRPPIFADIRLKRSVRAPGFRDNALEELVGISRYRWLRKLGNANIGTRKRAKIADLSGIEDLRQLVIDAHQKKRRVIFFCNCAVPCDCHRSIVAKLLHKSATRKHTPIRVIEWPGGEPEAVKLAVPAKVVKTVLRGANRMPLDDVSARMRRKLASLPWCSRVELRCGDEAFAIVSGPAHLATTGWYLPVIGPDMSTETYSTRELKSLAFQLRKSLGYAER